MKCKAKQLIDISGVHNWGIVEHKVLQDLGLNWSDLYSVVCRILEVWQNRVLNLWKQEKKYVTLSFSP